MGTRGPHSRRTIDRAAKLLAAGASQRAVARALGISKTSVAEIDRGVYRHRRRGAFPGTRVRFHPPVHCIHCRRKIRTMRCIACAMGRIKRLPGDLKREGDSYW